MKIHLSADYQSEFRFSPVVSLNGKLTAVELVTQFVHDSAAVTLSQDLLLPQLEASQQMRLLQSQINLLEQHHAFFEHHEIVALLRIDHEMAVILSDSELLKRKLKLLPFILLDVSETFPGLSAGRNNPLLASLKSDFQLSLSHFGAGNAPANAVYDNLFTCINLDSHFIHAMAKRASFMPFIQSIIDNFRSHCSHVTLCGVDDESLLKKKYRD